MLAFSQKHHCFFLLDSLEYATDLEGLHDFHYLLNYF